jgi:cell division protein FtsB
MRWLALGLLLLLSLLQYRLWLAEGSLAELYRLKAEFVQQQALNETLRVRNERLEEEVLELQQGLETVEERARRDLGMIREGEVYYQVVEKPPAEEKADGD